MSILVDYFENGCLPHTIILSQKTEVVYVILNINAHLNVHSRHFQSTEVHLCTCI